MLLAHGKGILARCVSQALERMCLVGGSGDQLGSRARLCFLQLFREKHSTNLLSSVARTACFPASWHPVLIAQPGLGTAATPWASCSPAIPAGPRQRKALWERRVEPLPALVPLPSFDSSAASSAHPAPPSYFLLTFVLGKLAPQGGLFPRRPPGAPGCFWVCSGALALPSFGVCPLD